MLKSSLINESLITEKLKESSSFINGLLITEKVKEAPQNRYKLQDSENLKLLLHYGNC